MKLFNLGFPKSGTSTVDRALLEAGLRTAHWEVPEPGPGYIGPAIYRRYFERVDPLLDLTSFDAVSQADFQSYKQSFWPQMDFALIRQILHFHPECRLVLVRRNPSKIADSIVKWGDMQRRLAATGAPGLPIGYATDRENLIRWITGHYAVCRGVLGNFKGYFEIDIESPDAREILSKAIETPLPWWGRENEGKNTVFKLVSAPPESGS